MLLLLCFALHIIIISIARVAIVATKKAQQHWGEKYLPCGANSYEEQKSQQQYTCPCKQYDPGDDSCNKKKIHIKIFCNSLVILIFFISFFNSCVVAKMLFTLFIFRRRATTDQQSCLSIQLAMRHLNHHHHYQHLNS